MSGQGRTKVKAAFCNNTVTHRIESMPQAIRMVVWLSFDSKPILRKCMILMYIAQRKTKHCRKI
jgi:hypothetical protein